MILVGPLATNMPSTKSWKPRAAFLGRFGPRAVYSTFAAFHRWPTPVTSNSLAQHLPKLCRVFMSFLSLPNDSQCKCGGARSSGGLAGTNSAQISPSPSGRTDLSEKSLLGCTVINCMCLVSVIVYPRYIVYPINISILLFF